MEVETRRSQSHPGDPGGWIWCVCGEEFPSLLCYTLAVGVWLLLEKEQPLLELVKSFLISYTVQFKVLLDLNLHRGLGIRMSGGEQPSGGK